MAKLKQYRVLTENKSDVFVGGKWVYMTTIRRVRLMAEAEGYAMVCNLGCIPFCVQSKALSEYVPPAPTKQGGNKP